MSEFQVEVVRISTMLKHPNADALMLSSIHGYPVITRTGDFAEGDLAVYVPVDAVVPVNDPRWAFLAGHVRIRARKLRGVFSMGLLTAIEPGMQLGENVAERMAITKYAPPETEGNEPDPGHMPVYTDIDAYRRYGSILEPGEEVIAVEKLHGENARAVYADGRLWVGSRTGIKKDTLTSQWWRAARAYNLAEKLATVPGIIIFGETHGYTGGFPYGVGRGEVGLRLFDAMDSKTRRYFDYDEFVALAAQLKLPACPLLYRGPNDPAVIRQLAEGRSTLDPSHVREGVVVRPVKERVAVRKRNGAVVAPENEQWVEKFERVILKLHGEGFLLEK